MSIILPEELHFGLALSVPSNEKTGGSSGAAGVGSSTALARIRRHDFRLRKAAKKVERVVVLCTPVTTLHFPPCN